jgi:ABC-type polysaccharide/polyol phosphate export permease
LKIAPFCANIFNDLDKWDHFSKKEKPFMVKAIKEIFRYRELLFSLVIRDLKVKYKNSVLGYLWSLIDPLLTVLLFVVVFKIIVRIKVENYPIFLISAVLPWGLLQGSLNGAVVSISGNANLVKKVYLPRETFPFSVLISNLINFFLSLAVFIPIIFIFQVKITTAFLVLPLVVILQLILIGGIALLSASLNVFFNDVGFILKFVLSLWFYLSPVFYPISFVPERFRDLYLLNPMAVILSLYRFAILRMPPPGTRAIFIASAISLSLFIGGYLVFKRTENDMVKRL